MHDSPAVDQPLICNNRVLRDGFAAAWFLCHAALASFQLIQYVSTACDAAILRHDQIKHTIILTFEF